MEVSNAYLSLLPEQALGASDTRSTDEGGRGAKADRSNLNALGVGHAEMATECSLGRIKEILTKSQGYRTCHQDQFEVEHRDYLGHGLPYESTYFLAQRRYRLARRPSRFRQNGES